MSVGQKQAALCRLTIFGSTQCQQAEEKANPPTHGRAARGQPENSGATAYYQLYNTFIVNLARQAKYREFLA
jgi:hypothetical protein